MTSSPSLPKPPSVLIVDDEPTLRLGFSFALKTENYDVETASDGRAALETMAEADFDAIMLDLRMPRLSGLETLSEMRAKSVDAPVLMCSAHITPATVIEALKLSCFDFLTKPVKPNELRCSIRNLLAPDCSDPMQQTLSNLRNRQFTLAQKSFENVEDLSPKKKAFWEKLLKDLGSPERLDTAFYIENYGRDLLPLLSFSDQ